MGLAGPHLRMYDLAVGAALDTARNEFERFDEQVVSTLNVFVDEDGN